MNMPCVNTLLLNQEQRRYDDIEGKLEIIKGTHLEQLDNYLDHARSHYESDAANGLYECATCESNSPELIYLLIADIPVEVSSTDQLTEEMKGIIVERFMKYRSAVFSDIIDTKDLSARY